jgi:hypothetical protein
MSEGLNALLLGILLLLSDFWTLPLILGMFLFVNATSPDPPSQRPLSNSVSRNV